MIPIKANVSTTLIMHIQKTVPKSTTDWNVVNLMDPTMPASWNTAHFIASSVLELCTTNHEAVEAAEIHKSFITMAAVTKTMFPRHTITTFRSLTPTIMLPLGSLSWIAFNCS